MSSKSKRPQMRVIDAVAAADAVSEKCGIPIADLVDVFADIQTVDAVQVVRCKDCEFWYGGKMYAPNFNTCRMWSASGTTRYTADMDFCSKGERKTTAEEAEYDELCYSWARDEYESPIY